MSSLFRLCMVWQAKHYWFYNGGTLLAIMLLQLHVKNVQIIINTNTRFFLDRVAKKNYTNNFFFNVHKVAKSLKDKATQNVLHVQINLHEYQRIKQEKGKRKRTFFFFFCGESCLRRKYIKCNKKISWWIK